MTKFHRIPNSAPPLTHIHQHCARRLVWNPELFCSLGPRNNLRIGSVTLQAVRDRECESLSPIFPLLDFRLSGRSPSRVEAQGG